MDFIRGLLARWLKVPVEPQAPDGAPGSLRVFRAARPYYWLRLATWAAGQVSALIGLLVALAVFHGEGGDAFFRHSPRMEWVRTGLGILEILGFVGFLIQLPITWLIVRLEYEMRWYLVTDRSLRIRSGIWVMEELTMTYANIQELTVHQGPLERLLGISNLKVRSAGGGGGGGGEGPDGFGKRVTHVGFFRGVADAASIRDVILSHLRTQGSAGLGDVDEAPARRAASTAEGLHEPIEAARALLAEAAAWRAALDQRGSP